MRVEADRLRLLRMLANGPERRMAQDAAHGWGAQRADVEQARRYRALLTALGRGEDVPEVGNAGPRDVLGLDRSTLD